MSDQKQGERPEPQDHRATPPPPPSAGGDHNTASVPTQRPGGQAYPPGGQYQGERYQQHHESQPYPQQQGPPPPQQYHPGQTQIVAAKSPALALIASFFFPGLGSILNGEVVKGVIFLVADFFTWALSILLWIVLLGWILIPVLLGIWIWAMVDAYSGAQRWNARHGIIS